MGDTRPTSRRILVVGSIPHPVGGVTNATWRLLHALAGRGHGCELLDLHPADTKYALPSGVRTYTLPSVVRWTYPVTLLPWLAFGGWDLVHYNFSSLRRLRHFGASLTRTVHRDRRHVLTLHHGDQSSLYRRLDPISAAIVRRALRSFDGVTALSPLQYEFFRTEVGLDEQRVRLTRGYVPPPWVDDPAGGTRFAELDGRASHLLVISGSPTAVYGYEHAFDLIERWGDALDLHLTLCLYGSARSPDYERGLLTRANRSQRISTFRDLDFPDFVALLRKADVFLRPSYTDSTCITVRDCVAMGVPVVASDCVERPEGTVVFPVGQQDGFEEAVRTVLSRPRKPGDPLAGSNGDGEDIVSIIEQLGS